MAKYTYHLECPFNGEMKSFMEAPQEFCRGYLRALRDQYPRLDLRIRRSDGKIIEELKADDDVSIGMVAGWPTAEQYEFASERALEKARKIRENRLTNEKRRHIIVE